MERGRLRERRTNEIRTVHYSSKYNDGRTAADGPTAGEKMTLEETAVGEMTRKESREREIRHLYHMVDSEKAAGHAKEIDI